MEIQIGNYVIVNIVGKRVLLKTTAATKDGKRFKGRKEQEGDKEETMEFQLKEVVANLGNSPTPGSAYNVKVEPLREHLEAKWFDEVKVYHPLNDKRRARMKGYMQDFTKKLEKKRLPEIPTTLELRTQSGTMMGFYKYRPKAETDLMCIKLDDELSDMEYRFAHEYAHGLWYRHFTAQMRMAWINLFHSAVAVTAYTNKELKNLLDDLKTNGDLRAFMKDNPDDLPVLRAILKHIKVTHAMERSHFELAMTLGQDIDQYWPSAVELGEKNQLVSKYAMKSPEELWAESFSLQFIGKKLPSKIEVLRDKCMARLTK